MGAVEANQIAIAQSQFEGAVLAMGGALDAMKSSPDASVKAGAGLLQTGLVAVQQALGNMWPVLNKLAEAAP